MKIDEKRIAYLMKTLDITREEALELEGYDADVTAGKKTEYDLTAEQQAIIYRMSEAKKIALSTNAIANMTVVINEEKYSLTMDNNELIKIAHNVFEKIVDPIRKVLKDSRLSPSDLEAIVLVGGSCKMPTVAAISGTAGLSPVRISTPIPPSPSVRAFLRESKLRIRILRISS